MRKKRKKRRKAILISACLIGVNCKYNGKNNKLKNIKLQLSRYEIIDVCPEKYGNLSTPREKSEIKNGEVVTESGKKITKNFQKGAKKTLKKAKKYRVRCAILKSKSPSCGFGEIYDGTFRKQLVSGNGITTALLIKNKIRIISSDTIDWNILKR